MQRLRQMENSGMLRLLVMLYNNPRATRTELLDITGFGHGTFYKNLERLKEFKLVVSKKQDEFPFSVKTIFTPKGEAAAAAAHKIWEILNEVSEDE